MLTTQQALAKLKTDLQLRGRSPRTLVSYLAHTRIFLDHCNRPIEELDETDIRDFLEQLITVEKRKPSTLNSYSSAIRFFFAVTLNRTLNYMQIPRSTVPKYLPTILSREEVAAIIASAANVKHKAILLLAYGSGLRVNEIALLKPTDIDSKAMRILVRAGKGQKDRFTLLPKTTLRTLREYWRVYRPDNPDGYLFPGARNIGHISTRGIQYIFYLALKQTNIKKESISPHTFRHCFATFLLEDGLSLLQIKELMGHATLNATTVYIHLANTTRGVTSPADILPMLKAGDFSL